MKKINFDNGKITQNILQTAFPMLIAQILNLLYSIVDRIYIGRIPKTGSYALGAVGLCFPIIMIIAGFTNMYGMGGAPLFSIELGRKDREKAGQIQNTSFRLLLLTGLIITAAGELLGEPMLRLFGAVGEEIPLSLSYLRVYLIGTVPLMLSTGMNVFINAQGYAMVGMISVTAGAVSNLILDPLFIFTLHMGVEGAAAATVLSQLISMFFTMRFLLGRLNEFPVRFALSFPFAKQIMTLGTAPFIMQGTNSLVQIACNSVLMRFGGVLYVSVMTIISSVRSILDVPVMAVTEGTSPIISFNYGASRFRNVRKAVRVMMTIAVPYTGLVWILILLKPLWFVRIFSSDPAILEAAERAVRIYFAAFIFQSLQYSGQTVFKALNRRKNAIFFSLLRKAVLVVPLTFLLPHLFSLGTDGVFMAEPISNVVGGMACFITMLCTVWREISGEKAGQNAGGLTQSMKQ